MRHLQKKQKLQICNLIINNWQKSEKKQSGFEYYNMAQWNMHDQGHKISETKLLHYTY